MLGQSASGGETKEMNEAGTPGQDSQISELQQRLRSLEAQAISFGLAQVMTRSFPGEIRYWSRGMERLYGFTAAEAIGQISHELLRTEFPGSLQDLNRELRERAEWTGELHHRRRDGQRVVVISHQSLLPDAHHDTPLVTEVNNEITAEWRGRGSRLYLASIVESSDDAIIAKTLQGVVTAWNQAAERMLGYTADEMIGQPITRLHPPDRLQEEAMILDRLRGGERLHHYETVRRRKDGSEVHVSLTVSPILSASGKIIGASKILRDLTDERQNRSRILALQSELVHAARLSTMGQLASAIAHELNQPLTAIASYSGALSRVLSNPNPDLKIARDALGRIRQQATRAGEVIRRLRDHVAKRETAREPHGVNAVVSEALEMALVGSRHWGIHTVTRLDEAVGSAFIDSIQIGQVIINLVRNAVEAMESSERRELTVATRSVSGAVEITVADTGPGLAPEVAQRLFEPFVTSKPSGMGLGLSICREIAAAHEGELSSAPNPGGGTVFTLRLPVEAE